MLTTFRAYHHISVYEEYSENDTGPRGRVTSASLGRAKVRSTKKSFNHRMYANSEPIGGDFVA